MAVNRNKYHIQLKRTRLEVDTERIQNYGIVFGEPVYLNQEQRFVIGPAPAEGSTTTTIPDSPAIKLVSQTIEDPEVNSETPVYVDLVENNTFFKNRTSENIVNLTDDDAYTIYPITKMSAVKGDGTYELSEYLLNKLNIDKTTQVPYPSLGVDSEGVFVDQFEPEPPSEIESLINIINSKVSIDSSSSSAVTHDLSLGVDLYGVYVRFPPEEAEELNYIKSYIDMMLADSINTRLLALEGNVYYLQELINNIGSVYVGPTPPSDTNRLWIDTTVLTGGLKYCSNIATLTWSHVPVAYT